jgi:nucleotide-binding universal stress UspA family protein
MQDRPIVVGIDGTPTALRAVAWAAHEAVLRQRPLRLVHAAPYLGTADDPDGSTRARANAVLTRARAVARQIAPDLTTNVAALPDPPVAALVDASADAELLVVGMVAGADGEIVLGTVTLDVTTGAHCPVTVVRGDSAMDHPTKGHRGRAAPVMLGIESVAADAAAVSVAFDDAARHGSGLIVVHVPSHPDHLDDSATTVRDQLAPWRSAHPDVEVSVRIGQGNPGVALLHESTVVRHIVLGARGRHLAVRAVLGSVSRFVLRHSLVPVTVVPRSLSTTEGSYLSTGVAGNPHDRSQLW